MYKKKLHNRGISLIEVLISVALFTLSVASIGTMGISGMNMARDSVDRYRAVLFAREGVAAARTIRAEDFSQLTPGTHGLVFSGGMWQLSATPDTIDKFTRSVEISNAGSGRLKVALDVEWQNSVGISAHVEADTFVDQLFGARWTQTTEVDFLGGKQNGTEVVALGDGGVGLPLYGDWAKPKEFASYNVPDQGTMTSLLESDGTLYAASMSASADLLTAIDLADVGRDVLTVLHETNVGATVAGIAVSGGYVFLATNGDSRELVALRRSDLSIVRTVDLTGTADAISITATGTTLYLGRAQSTNPEIYEFDISDPEAGITTVRSVHFSGNVAAVTVMTGYVLIGTTANTTELGVLRMSDLTLVNSFDLPGNADVSSMLVEMNSLYLGRTQSGSEEVVRIDMVDPLGSLATNGGADVTSAVRALALGADGRLYVATGLPNSEVIAYALPSFAAPLAYDVTLGAGASALVVVGPYVYAGLQNNDPELVVLRGGTGQWINPTVNGTLNLPTNANGKSIAVSGAYAYVGTMSSAGPEFSVLNISDPSQPSIVGTAELGADINGITLIGPFAYLATSNNAQELTIVNIADPAAPFVVGSYDTPGNFDGVAVAASSTFIALATRNNTGATGREAHLFSTAIPASPVLLAQGEVGADANGVAFNPNGFLLLATANNAKELMAFDLRVSGAMTEVASYSTPGNPDALAVSMIGQNNIALLTQNNASSPDLFLLTENSINGTLTVNSSMDLNADNNAIASANGLLFVGNDLSGNGLTVIDPANMSAPTVVGMLLFDSPVLGVAADAQYAYIASSDNSREFTVVAPNPLLTARASLGWLTSSAFDAGSSSVEWGTLSWNKTGTGTVSMQIRTADTQSGLLNALWSGAGGILGSTYASPGLNITSYPLASGREWIQYRIKLEGDSITTPVVTDVDVTYQ